MTVPYQARAVVAQEGEAAAEHPRVVAGEEMDDKREAAKNHKDKHAKDDEESEELEKSEVAREAFGGQDHVAAAEHFGGVAGEDTGDEDDEAADEDDGIVWEEFIYKDNLAAQEETGHEQVGAENREDERAKEAGPDEDDGHGEEAADHAGGEEGAVEQQEGLDEVVAEQQQRLEWVIVAAVPRIESASEFLSGQNIACVINNVPTVSFLRISRLIGHDTSSCQPHVVAADQSGVLLLFSGSGYNTGPAEPVVQDSQDLYYTTEERDDHPTLYLCHPASGIAAIVPNPSHMLDRGEIGLIPIPGCRHRYMLAGLRQQHEGNEDKETAYLCTYSTTDGEWQTRKMKLSGTYSVKDWTTNSVISHSKRLWWLSLRHGLVWCDVLDPQSTCMHHIALPLPEGYAPIDSDAYEKSSCVKESSGMLRYVLLYLRFGIPTIGMWSLIDSEKGLWQTEYTVALHRMWSAECYKAKGLKKTVPCIALVHPLRPDVLFFTQESQMFSMNMICLNDIQSATIDVVFPTEIHYSSRFFHMWKLQQPQAIQDGPAPAIVMEMPPPNWIMLAAMPRVAPGTEFPQGQDLLTVFESPPRMSSLVLSRRVCVTPLDKDSPMVISTSPSGMFLLMASKERLLPTEGKAEESGFSITINTELKPYFYLCNIYEGNSVLLPFPDHNIDPDFLGLFMHPVDSRRHIVAELLPDPKAPVLFCVGDGNDLQWEKKELEYSHEYFPGTWAKWKCQNVLAYRGEMWWFVPDYGLFHCDPFLQKPRLRLQRLPPVRDKSESCWGKKKERLVQVSGGELRYLVVHGPNKKPAVTIFTLDDDGDWSEEPYEFFEWIFIHKSWISNNLIRQKPTILLMDPYQPNIVYFAQWSRIFSVDLDTNQVLTCEHLEMRQGDEVKPEWYFSRHVRAWELPSTHSLMALGLIKQWALRHEE